MKEFKTLFYFYNYYFNDDDDDENNNNNNLILSSEMSICLSFISRRKEPIRGTKHGATRLKAAEGSAWLYIGRLSPDTTKGDILEYLSENGVEGIIHCDMVSDNINSKAFKIGIPMQELERVHNSSFWASGIYCRPFRQPWKFRGARGCFMRHVMIQCGDKGFVCSVSGKTFTGQISLNRQVKLHTETFPLSLW